MTYEGRSDQSELLQQVLRHALPDAPPSNPCIAVLQSSS